MASAPAAVGSYRNGNNTMPTAIAALAMLVGLGGLFWQAANPKGDLQSVRYDMREDIKRAEERIDREINQIKWDINNKAMTIAQHNEFASRIDKAADILRDEINRIRADQVTRSEHQQHWNEQTERMNALNQRLKDIAMEQNAANDSMRKEFGSTFTAADQMKNLQDQIKTLQNQFNTMSRGSAPIAPTMGQSRSSSTGL